MRNITIVDTIDTHKALILCKKTGVKLADCLIATQVRKGIVLCTYDKEFSKIPSVRTMTPEEVLQGIQ
jgi:predicted nucleic acid-binding protein